MQTAANVNDGRLFQRRNDNDNIPLRGKYQKAREVDRIADKLVTIFNNPGARPFYCKVGWKLSEAIIWQNVEKAQSVKKGSQVKLFTYLCKVSGV